VRPPFLQRVWGADRARPVLALRVGWTDLFIVVGLAGLLYGILDFGSNWTVPHRPQVEIDLSPLALPHYTFLSLARGLCAYALSLGFTLVYGYWAAKDARARRVLLPLLDVLQSIPVLGFMPGLVLALVAAFPNSNVGLELTAVIMIFTGQAWNMTFSFYQSVSSVPQDLREAATVYRFNWWQLFRKVELPFAMIGLVWNSMMSMAGGWFFLTVTEAFKLGDRDFRLPGIGSYMSVAIEDGRVDAMCWAVLAMTLMIVGLDQLLWRPVVVWAQKYRVEESAGTDVASSWFLNLLRRSRILELASGALARLWPERAPRPTVEPSKRQDGLRSPSGLDLVPLTVLVGVLAYGAWRLIGTVWEVPGARWLGLVQAGGWTLGRVLLATALGTLWTVPVGLAIGLTPRLARLAQPVVQVVASFPAPMLFPLVTMALKAAGISLDWGSIVLMLLGTQWYILFNVVAGAMAVPADLREAADAYRLGWWQRFRLLYVPAIFPYLVTGWVTAAGGAWNASIVSEYVPLKKGTEILRANGLGEVISDSAERGNIVLLTAGVLVMSLLVVTFNRTVWRRCYRLAETRFALNR
jgi:NitT/TauT family transport system permease protein